MQGRVRGLLLLPGGRRAERRRGGKGMETLQLAQAAEPTGSCECAGTLQRVHTRGGFCRLPAPPLLALPPVRSRLETDCL